MKKWKNLFSVLSLVALVVIIGLNYGKKGKFMGVPYDFTMPTPAKLQERFWNPDNPDILVPHGFGWGYSVNFGAIARKLGLVGKGNGA
jgi:uncharacterized membrane protein